MLLRFHSQRILLTIVNALFLIFAIGLLSTQANDDPERLNVLFIAVDDLRPELGCYGHPDVLSPNIDRLASEGTTFTRAYCQQAVCNPSRASLMTGVRPESLGVMDLPTHFRDVRPESVTVSQYFKQNGYHAQRVGKIYHTGHGNHDDPHSWTEYENFPLGPRYGPFGTEHLQRRLQEAREQGIDLKDNRLRPRGLPWEAPDVEDHELTDGGIARAGVELIQRHKDEPFFIAVGFQNPHLPFVAPKKYWDLYDPSKIELADNPEPPRDAPSYAACTWGELRKYHDIPESGPLSEEQARNMIHGYWAATSYVDALVGNLLDELDRLDLRKNTVVILWGDHGWQLGEHGFWCKHTNYEVAARSPLIISVPGQTEVGVSCERLVEFVDIYPSLADICGLPEPAGLELEGHSFKPLLEDPKRPWKKAATHVYPRNMPGHGGALGRALRTERYRLVEWSPNNSDYAEYELYDHENDPDENVNIAGRPESEPIIAELTELLHAGWEAALPEAP